MGGAGYLGSVLVRKLLNHGFQVRVLDNLLYGEASTRQLMSHRDYELIVGDIRDMRTLVKALNNVDAIVHLAAIVGDQAADLDSKTTMEINYLATKNIAELCSLYGIKKFIFASTCTVYGLQPGKLLTEESEPAPFSSYGITKYKSEKALLALEDLSPTIIRMGTLYGLSARMRFDLVINLFIARAIQERRITVFGGKQNRPFLHVEDAAEAYRLALEKDCNGLFNLGGENISILDLAKKVKEFIPSTAVEISPEIVDKRDYMISSSKIQRLLDFRNKKMIRDAIFEIKQSFDSGDIKDYTLAMYRNYESLFSSPETQKKVYTLGPIFERTRK